MSTIQKDWLMLNQNDSIMLTPNKDRTLAEIVRGNILANTQQNKNVKTQHQNNIKKTSATAAPQKPEEKVNMFKPTEPTRTSSPLFSNTYDWEEDQKERMNRFGIGLLSQNGYTAPTQMIRKTSTIDPDAEELTQAGTAAFLEGFNEDYEGRQALPSNVQAAVKDMKNRKPGDLLRQTLQLAPKIDGEEKKTGNSSALGNMVASINNGFDEIEKGVSNFSDYRKENGTINAISKALNDYGLLDNVTNGFFRAYDFAQKNPGVVSAIANEVWNIVDPLPSSAIEKLMNVDLAVQMNYPLKMINDAIHNHIAENNYEKNQEVDLSKYYNNDGYINDQNVKDSTMRELKYGKWDMYNNGCELIAVHNSLNTLNERKDIRDIAKEFEEEGQTLYGYLGTSPYAVGRYFKKRGYDVKTYEGDDTISNLSLPKADSYILSFWNNDRFSSAIHTVSIKEQDDGSYIVYNSDGRSADFVCDLAEYLSEERKYGKRVPLVLHCISKRRRVG